MAAPGCTRSIQPAADIVTRMRRLLAAVAVAAVLGLAIAVVWPQLIGVQQVPIFAQVTAFRGLIVAVCVLLIVMLGISTIRSSAGRRFGLALMAVAAAAVAVNGIVITSRGADAGRLPLNAPEDAVVVLAWNTLGDSPALHRVAGLIERTDADVVALPETSSAFADEIVAAVARKGIRLQAIVRADSDELKALSTVLLVRPELAAADDTTIAGRTNLPSVPAATSIGRVVAVHATAPLPSAMSDWSADLSWLSEACSDARTIMAGDFNATIDHMAHLADGDVDGAAIGQCRDAATLAGSGAAGTWPSALPAFLGTPIDHVMIGAAWRVADYAVITDGAGSDHRPIVTALVPAG